MQFIVPSISYLKMRCPVKKKKIRVPSVIISKPLVLVGNLAFPGSYQRWSNPPLGDIPLLPLSI